MIRIRMFLCLVVLALAVGCQRRGEVTETYSVGSAASDATQTAPLVFPVESPVEIQEGDLKIVFEIYNNPEVAGFNINRKLSENGESWYDSKSQSALFKSIMDIDGVERLSFDRYEADVTKGKAFTWDEVRPRVVEVLKKHFPPDAAQKNP